MRTLAVLFFMMTICSSGFAQESQARIQIDATGKARVGTTISGLVELTIKNQIEVVKVTCGAIKNGSQTVWITKEPREMMGIKTSDSPEVSLQFLAKADCAQKVHALRARTYEPGEQKYGIQVDMPSPTSLSDMQLL